MSRLHKHPTLVIFFSAFILGLCAGHSWLSFLSIMGGFALVALVALICIPLERRQRIRKSRPVLERLLDEMIQTALASNKPIEKSVIFNAERQEADRIVFHLQLAGGIRPSGSSLIYDLKVETVPNGKVGGSIQVKIAVYAGSVYREGLAYPDFSSWIVPEPWLTVRLKTIRTLVGDVSLVASHQRRPEKYGFEIGDC